MRVLRPAAAALCAALLAPAAGCDDPLRPSDVAGVYALRQIAGDPLPAVGYVGGEITTYVLADTLRLRADGSGTGVQVFDVEGGVQPGRSRAISSARDVRVRTVGDRVEIEYVCGPLELCAAPPHLAGRLRGDALHVDFALGGRVPRVYARVAGAP